ncbi:MULTISPECIES: TIGR00153 family protein [unclassified Motilimonas]|uniref:TIGR00153 family protein n=1 Tax=Motilimonas TaxID=1914248 RepID=UPI001E2A0CAA|nr:MULTISPECIES: TIGR00153 family protein [unclassified Motilimonas]MCE0557424.1 TIGR00153 family protein [Motilimonas sp. E26]MDO6526878.1 TIGR00153 family protein [Motilimonas sp. 1_MG-2023]
MPVNTILGLFAKSPIKPLQEHINKVHHCCKLLIPFFEAVNVNDWEEAERRRAEISQAEKQADDLKREIRLKLPRGIFMPVERTDMLELLTQQDKIANKAKDISGRILGRQLTLPADTQVDFMAYVKRCIDATNQAKKAINELDELLETGFKGREVELVEEMIHRLDEIEDDTDRLQVKLRRHFQQVEAQYNPIDMMFLYQILEWVGDLADQAERVGARLELMLARS